VNLINILIASVLCLSCKKQTVQENMNIYHENKIDWAIDAYNHLDSPQNWIYSRVIISQDWEGPGVLLIKDLDSAIIISDTYAGSGSILTDLRWTELFNNKMKNQ